jgi:hypothetical protein
LDGRSEKTLPSRKTNIVGPLEIVQHENEWAVDTQYVDKRQHAIQRCHHRVTRVPDIRLWCAFAQ